MLGWDFGDKVWSRFVFELVSNPIGYFGKMNSTLGSVVPLAMFMSNLLYWSLTSFRMISENQSIINKSVLSSFKLQPLLIVSLPSLPSPTSLTARSSIIHQIEVSWPDTATTTATIATVTFQTASDQLPSDDLPCRRIQSKSELDLWSASHFHLGEKSVGLPGFPQ